MFYFFPGDSEMGKYFSRVLCANFLGSSNVKHKLVLYHVSGRRSLFHSTPARAVMASVTGLSESPVVVTTAANER